MNNDRISQQNNIEEQSDSTINAKVKFSNGRIAQVLRKLEKFLGIPLSLRSITGEVVCKTDYFYGPCSFIRGTDLGCKRCRKVYSSIEKKILRRKVPYACLCYNGFLVFAVPLNFRGEMIGILFGSQILPCNDEKDVQNFKKSFIKGSAKTYELQNNDEFIASFDKLIKLDDNKQRVQFLSYLEEIGQHFVEMAIADKPWKVFLREIKQQKPEFGAF